jgi:predicted RNase H-like HicB family nuclease
MRNVLVSYHHEDGSWWADSPTVEGFTAVGDTLEETRLLVREGVDFYLDGEQVRLVEYSDNGAALDVRSAVSVDRPGWWTEATSVVQGFAASFGGPGARISTPVSVPVPA